MLSVNRVWSAFASTGVLLVAALGAGCGADSPNPDTQPGVGGTAGSSLPATSISAGGSAAASAGSRAAAGVGGAASTSTSGLNGASGAGGAAAQSGSVAGSGAAGAGVQAGVAGTVGAAGNAATAGATAAAGSGGSSGAAGATAGAGGSESGGSSFAGCEVKPITDDMRSRYENMDDDYYTKYALANEVVVATGAGVGDEALIRYCHLMTEFVSNDKVRDAIIADKMWFTMIAEDEQLSSLPQINRQFGTSFNQRARGLGGLTPTICAEDSIMCSPRDKWRGDCICPHETGHTLYSSGIARVPDLSRRLTEITSATRSSGRLANAYVWQDGNESGMMAWGVQAWYDCAIDGTMGAYHSDINTRAELEKELPEFYEFLSELLPKDNQYKDCYANP